MSEPRMSASNKWKSKLVSSSFPLEFEVAKKLVKHGFSITADYVYARNDSGVIKDFSVDLAATAYLPFSKPNSMNSQISLLVECKQRHQNVKWLFFPDPNRPNLSPFTLGYTIRAVDEFSRKFFKPNTTVEVDIDVPCCYKGVEIDEGNNNKSDQQKDNDKQKDTSRVYDSELKHGVSQLQYALPRLSSDLVLINFDELPFLICPILLTTSES